MRLQDVVRVAAIAVFTLAAVLPSARANTVYTFATAAGAQYKSLALDATVVFTISGSNLYVSMTNDEADPTAASQLLSDLSFVLSSGDVAGTLSDSISSEVGSSSPVTVLDSNFNTTTTTTKPSSWKLTDNDSSSTSCGQSTSDCFFLNDLTGGQPQDLIIGPGPYGGNASITNFAPSLAGTVVFEIDGITGLGSTTTVNNVYLSFGTGPDYVSALTTVQMEPPPPTTPEPVSLVLVGAGLLGLGIFRRRRAN